MHFMVQSRIEKRGKENENEKLTETEREGERKEEISAHYDLRHNTIL